MSVLSAPPHIRRFVADLFSSRAGEPTCLPGGVRATRRPGSRTASPWLATTSFPSTTDKIGQADSRRDRGEFVSAEAALGHAKHLIDEALLEHFKDASSVHDLMSRYMRKGRDVPMIYGEPRVAFHAYQYAREKANAMFAMSSD